jgi:glycosyltransferase involved in cell wall biosynthesis
MADIIAREIPLVSVLMTAYNREEYIVEAIESVLSSTYLNFELIIVDDCSSDNTYSIAKTFEAKDIRVKVFANEKNRGDYPNRNIAASYAKGEFLMYVDSDDTIVLEGIERCTAAMMLYPDAGFGIYNISYNEHPFLMNSVDAIKDHFFKTAFLLIGPGGTIIRRTYFEQINGYPEKYGPANDMYFNIKAACYSPIVLLPFNFINYRRHAGQEINNWLSYLPNNYLYLKDAMNELPLKLSPQEISWIINKNKRRFLVNICKYLFRTGNLINTQRILNSTEFSFRNALQAVFHL